MIISRKRYRLMKRTISKQKQVIEGQFAFMERLLLALEQRDRRIKTLETKLNSFVHEDPETVDFPKTIKI